MKFQIKNRWSGDVQFECELSAEIAGRSYGFQLGFAVKQALGSGAVLRGANLSCADLRDADLRDEDLSGANLSDADLSDADLRDAVLSGAVLRGAVLRGANLSGAVLRGANLRDADLRYADLRGTVLRGANLRDADLRYADLRDADLRGTVLRYADLRGTVLRYADLRGTDLRGADGSSWIPRIENIHSAVYEAASKPDALDMGSWHGVDGYCGTTHCRAGWVVVLAGPGGRVLEGVYGTPAAAALIYQASDPTLAKVPNFYAGNADALADMKRLADEEAAR